MKVGDLVRIKYGYDGTTGLIVKVERQRKPRPCLWIHLHTGESFKPEYLEVINASR